jgi:transketolase
VIDHYVFVICSDGDLMEGVSHEAASLAGHQQLGKLIVLFDNNGITIDGSTNLSCSDNHLLRFKAYGWNTIEVDGHNFDEIDAALVTAKQTSTKPTLISCKTIIGYGSEHEGTCKIHSGSLGLPALSQMKYNLQWDFPDFAIPCEIK